MISRLYRHSSLRLFSSARLPNRIFSNFDQGGESSVDAPMDSSEKSFSNVRKHDASSTLAFPEEALQDYNLSAFPNASSVPLSQETMAILSEPIDETIIEIKPDGSCYLPEVHYRRLLNKAFGISGWTLIPRGPHSIQANILSREYALFANGRFISQARGHTTLTGTFQNPAMCTESVRSNSLMRCCKDLGISAALWDNGFINQWKFKFANRKSITDYQGRSKFVWEKKRSE